MAEVVINTRFIASRSVINMRVTTSVSEVSGRHTVEYRSLLVHDVFYFENLELNIVIDDEMIVFIASSWRAAYSDM